MPSGIDRSALRSTGCLGVHNSCAPPGSWTIIVEESSKQQRHREFSAMDNTICAIQRGWVENQEWTRDSELESTMISIDRSSLGRNDRTPAREILGYMYFGRFDRLAIQCGKESKEPGASLSREIAGRRLMCPCQRLPSSVSLSSANQWLSGPPNFNHYGQLGLSCTIFQSVHHRFTACSPGPPGSQVVFPSSLNGHLIQLVQGIVAHWKYSRHPLEVSVGEVYGVERTVWLNLTGKSVIVLSSLEATDALLEKRSAMLNLHRGRLVSGESNMRKLDSVQFSASAGVPGKYSVAQREAIADLPLAERKRHLDLGTAPLSFTAELLAALKDCGQRFHRMHNQRCRGDDVYWWSRHHCFFPQQVPMVNPDKAQTEVDAVTGRRYRPDFEDESCSMLAECDAEWFELAC
ncbi:hypothetical protein B0H13DRAFT_1867734 [Mycena leptocephala]|nr:hypothetical protein B0H13DRAFT_1867734 [Mycena leptocephala]